MRMTNPHRSARPAEDRVFWFDEEMAELSLLLPRIRQCGRALKERSNDSSTPIPPKARRR
jgi:hypothetical protein